MGASSSVNENTIKNIIGNNIDTSTYNTLKQKYTTYFKTMQMIDIKTDSGTVTLEDITQKAELVDYVAFTDIITDAQSLNLPTSVISQLEALQKTTSGIGISISKAKNDFETRVQNTLSQKTVNEMEKSCEKEAFNDQVIKVQTGSGNVVLKNVNQLLSLYSQCLGNTTVDSSKDTTASVTSAGKAAMTQETKGMDLTGILLAVLLPLVILGVVALGLFAFFPKALSAINPFGKKGSAGSGKQKKKLR